MAVRCYHAQANCEISICIITGSINQMCVCVSCVVEVPSSPAIHRVEPFSSTAVVEFDEPDSTGGVPIIKYRADWRVPGQDWAGREYDAEDGETHFQILPKFHIQQLPVMRHGC